MSLLPLVLFGSLGVWALFGRRSGVTTSGSVELQPGVRYRFSYASAGPVTLDEAAELLAAQSVAALAVTAVGNGYWLVSFEAQPLTVVSAKIGTPLTPLTPTITLAEVARLG